jgi:predicted dehydrogenase
MDVLSIGYSSLVQRRILPSLTSLDAVGSIHVASRRELPPNLPAGSQTVRVITGYERALAELESGLVYVSLPNSLHFEWCMRALSAGFHVVVDKPACLTASEASELASAARQKGLCCAEAIVWQCHPMLGHLQELKGAEGRAPIAASTWFTSPPLDEGNFRLVPALGGGVVYDRASYAISCGRVVFDQEPSDVVCTVSERDPRTGVDLSARITLQYPNGGSLDGFYSLKSDYRNSLTVVGETYNVDFDRVFTPPDDYEGPAIVRRQGRAEAVVTMKGNTFALFLESVFSAIKGGTSDGFADRMVRDAVIMDAIQDSAKGAKS